MVFEEELRLLYSEHVAISIDVCADPAFPDFGVILVAFDGQFSCWLLEFDSISITFDGEI